MVDGNNFNANDYLPNGEDASIEASTLSGDVRDVLLTHVRSMTIPWAMLSEDEQRDKIYALSECAKDLVRRALAAISTTGFPSIVVGIGAVKIDKGLEIKLSANSSVEVITKLAEHGKNAAVLVLAEAADFFGERAPAKPDKDQPDLPLSDAAE